MSLLLQTIILVYFTKDANSHTGSSSCRFVVVITYISSVLVVVITLFEIVFQAVSVKNDDSGNATSSDDINATRDSSSSDNISMTTIRIEDEVMNPVNSRVTTNGATKRITIMDTTTANNTTSIPTNSNDSSITTINTTSTNTTATSSPLIK